MPHNAKNIARKHKAWDANKDYVLALSFYFIFLISSNLKRNHCKGALTFVSAITSPFLAVLYYLLYAGFYLGLVIAILSFSISYY